MILSKHIVKVWLSIIFLLCAASILAGAACQANFGTDAHNSPANKRAMLSVEFSEYDMGSIIQGEKAVAPFVIHNIGSEALIIEKLVPSASYVTAEISEKSIASGEKGIIEVTLDTAAADGRLEGRIGLATNDPEEPLYWLKVFVTVKPLLSIKNPLVWVGNLARDASFSGRVELTGELVLQNKLKEMKIFTSSPEITVKLIRGMKENKLSAYLEFLILPVFVSLLVPKCFQNFARII